LLPHTIPPISHSRFPGRLLKNATAAALGGVRTLSSVA
jgi:hypothetical protein